MTPLLQVRSLTKTYGKETVLSDVNLNLQEGNVLSLLGSSGSGKTTLLKILAGLEKTDQGTISINGKEITHLKPQKRNIIYLYQESLLFPHLNAFENIAFGLRLKKHDKKEVKGKVREMLELLEMSDHAFKTADQLSGGQKQRISFGRAMIIRPTVLLLDEPFGALDSITRTKMQYQFKTLAGKMGTTAIFVTHDLKEAIVMGDQISQIKKGEFHQYERMQEFYKADDRVDNEFEFWKNIHQDKTQ